MLTCSLFKQAPQQKSFIEADICNILLTLYNLVQVTGEFSCCRCEWNLLLLKCFTPGVCPLSRFKFFTAKVSRRKTQKLQTFLWASSVPHYYEVWNAAAGYKRKWNWPIEPFLLMQMDSSCLTTVWCPNNLCSSWVTAESCSNMSCGWARCAPWVIFAAGEELKRLSRQQGLALHSISIWWDAFARGISVREFFLQVFFSQGG